MAEQEVQRNFKTVDTALLRNFLKPIMLYPILYLEQFVKQNPYLHLH